MAAPICGSRRPARLYVAREASYSGGMGRTYSCRGVLCIASSSMLEVAILGPGGVGGFLAGVLARAATPVTVVAREETATLLAERGLAVQSVLLGDFHVDVRAVTSVDAGGMTLVVATKATGLDAALERIQGEPPLVVPLL